MIGEAELFAEVLNLSRAAKVVLGGDESENDRMEKL